MSARSVFVTVLLVTLGFGGFAAAEDPYTQQQNVVYAEVHGIGLVMDIFAPTGKPNGLAIIDVASGAFHSDRGKINDHKLAQVYRIFCERGYKVFAVRPGSITKFTLPEMAANMKLAISWVKDHAKEQAIDPARIGIMGGSAGGHLASLAAVTGNDGKGEDGKKGSGKDTTIKAAAVFFPVTDFLNFKGQSALAADSSGESRIRKLAFPQGAGDLTQEQISQKLTEISPARMVNSKSPPFLIIHGDADPVVPLQQSELLLAALKKAGVSAELIVKPGGGHPWLTIHEEVKVMADWFDKQLASN